MIVRTPHLLCMATMLVPLASWSQPISGPYVSLGGGVNFAYDQAVRPSGFGPAPHNYIFDPGAAAQASVGFGFSNGLRIEAEGDYTDNHVHGTVYAPVYGSFKAGGYEQQYGGFGNVLYDLPFALPVRPYVGLGAGYQEVELDHINAYSFEAGTRGRAAPITRGNFAYQAIAGFSIPLPVPGLSITAEYRFIGVLSPGAYYRGSVNELVPVSSTGGAAPGSYIPSSGLPRFETIRLAEHATFSNIFDNEIMLGLRYAFNAAPPPPSAPAPVAAPAPAPARTYLVFFDWDSAILSPRAASVVAEAARNSAQIHTTTIEVDGYADTSHALPGGRGAQYNLRLSLRRAARVKAELIRDGVPANMIDTHGFGDTRLLVPTGPNVREPQNRRVEIVFR